MMDVNDLHAIIVTESKNAREDHAAIRDQIEAGIAEVKLRLDRINGRVLDHDKEISGLKVRDAFWAGGVVALAALIGWLLKG
jgi:ElaB/YqjD/DUF883 family membrane-anchored ribosome-binding protein